MKCWHKGTINGTKKWEVYVISWGLLSLLVDCAIGRGRSSCTKGKCGVKKFFDLLTNEYEVQWNKRVHPDENRLLDESPMRGNKAQARASWEGKGYRRAEKKKKARVGKKPSFISIWSGSRSTLSALID
ncbi:hypothetical protein BC826DRAFT_302046 [Russula brevipes]|nr:hypothetical protein BC826DRAFT_302046 [Russula brevipes]